MFSSRTCAAHNRIHTKRARQPNDSWHRALFGNVKLAHKCAVLNELRTRRHFFAGDAALAGDAAALAAGDALDAAAAVALLAGFAASVEAGRRPRLLGLASMSIARLFTIFASAIATSSKAVFKIFLRSSVSLTLICWRTPWLSSVRFSVCKCFSWSLKMYQRPPGYCGELNLTGAE